MEKGGEGKGSNGREDGRGRKGKVGDGRGKKGRQLAQTTECSRCLSTLSLPLLGENIPVSVKFR